MSARSITVGTGYCGRNRVSEGKTAMRGIRGGETEGIPLHWDAFEPDLRFLMPRASRAFRAIAWRLGCYRAPWEWPLAIARLVNKALPGWLLRWWFTPTGDKFSVPSYMTERVYLEHLLYWSIDSARRRIWSRFPRSLMQRPVSSGPDSLDDRHMYQSARSSPTCDECFHRIGYRTDSLSQQANCQAFPFLIPREIWDYPNSHDRWFPGDRGYRFRPMTPADREAHDRLRTRRWTEVGTQKLEILRRWQEESELARQGVEPFARWLAPRDAGWIWY